MKVSAATAQLFSEALYRIYAAGGEAALPAALAEAQATLGGGEENLWLQALLRGHTEHRREQIRHGAVTPPPAGGAGGGLTARERQVLQRVALGETDAAVGRALGISPKTAGKHLENIFRKLGVETRTAAVATTYAPAPRALL